MKFIFVYCVIRFSAFIVGTSEGAPNVDTRGKRSTIVETCLENFSPDECTHYAEIKSKSLPLCHTYELELNRIHWQNCGKVYCGENTRVVKEDLSKSYPDCCEHCEIIDENKDAYVSGTL